MNEELLYNQLYDKTKDCGRTQFVKLLMEKEIENKNLKDEIYKSNVVADTNRELAESYYKENQQLKKQISDLECLVESIKLGVTLNKKQEKLLDKILFRSEK